METLEHWLVKQGPTVKPVQLSEQRVMMTVPLELLLERLALRTVLQEPK